VGELTEKDFQMLRGTLKRWRNYAMGGTPLSLSVGVIDMLSSALDELGIYKLQDPAVTLSGEPASDTLTRRELIDIAKRHHITIPRNATKAAIIEAIQAAGDDNATG